MEKKLGKMIAAVASLALFLPGWGQTIPVMLWSGTVYPKSAIFNLLSFPEHPPWLVFWGTPLAAFPSLRHPRCDIGADIFTTVIYG